MNVTFSWSCCDCGVARSHLATLDAANHRGNVCKVAHIKALHEKWSSWLCQPLGRSSAGDPSLLDARRTGAHGCAFWAALSHLPSLCRHKAESHGRAQPGKPCAQRSTLGSATCKSPIRPTGPAFPSPPLSLPCCRLPSRGNPVSAVRAPPCDSHPPVPTAVASQLSCPDPSGATRGKQTGIYSRVSFVSGKPSKPMPGRPVLCSGLTFQPTPCGVQWAPAPRGSQMGCASSGNSAGTAGLPGRSSGPLPAAEAAATQPKTLGREAEHGRGGLGSVPGDATLKSHMFHLFYLQRRESEPLELVSFYVQKAENYFYIHIKLICSLTGPDR